MSGILAYKQTCPLCKALAFTARILDVRHNISTRPLTPHELSEYHAPLFIGNEGITTIGLVPVTQRVLWELTLPNHTSYVLRGNHIHKHETLVPQTLNT